MSDISKAAGAAIIQLTCAACGGGRKINFFFPPPYSDGGRELF